MVELILQRLENGQIKCEMEGGADELAKMICQAMIGNVEIASIVLGAVPTFIDEKGLSREGYCKTVMEAYGGKKEICKCRCHRDGTLTKHIRSCCSLTYKKYINTDNTLDLERYQALKNKKYD